MIGRNDDCWCGSKMKWKKCHFPQEAPESTFSQISFEEQSRIYFKKWGIILKTPKQIEGIRRANHLAAALLDEVCEKAKKGVSTNELDLFAEKLILSHKAIPASKGYGHPPFPCVLCTSRNDVICHGIPDDKPLQEGDIVNIDLALILDGYFGDCSKMVAIGPVSEDKKRVFDISFQCLQESVKILKPGVLLSKIGDVITSLAEKHNLSVVDQFVGHGVGIRYHEPPQVFHSRNNLDIPLVPNMTFTIEPMINYGVKTAVVDTLDHWTVRTQDRKPSAQWEYSLLITEDGVEILTPWRETHCELKKT
jgi:methionyl aminopeptidase